MFYCDDSIRCYIHSHNIMKNTSVAMSFEVSKEMSKFHKVKMITTEKFCNHQMPQSVSFYSKCPPSSTLKRKIGSPKSESSAN